MERQIESRTRARIVAPPGCLSCAHVERRALHTALGIEHDDCCEHPRRAGTRPMHEPCAWHSSRDAMRAAGNMARVAR